jgi:hypothetical protein
MLAYTCRLQAMVHELAEADKGPSLVSRPELGICPDLSCYSRWTPYSGMRIMLDSWDSDTVHILLTAVRSGLVSFLTGLTGGHQLSC